MIKLFTHKPIDRVNVWSISNKKIEAELNQAKGVINNYLKDKNFKVAIGDSPLAKNDCLDIAGFADSGKAMRKITIKKESDKPLLRNVYAAIENIAKEFAINKV